MAQEGQGNIIEIDGIVRSTSILGKQDGQSEDLINLRKKDGYWRPSTDGKLVFDMGGSQYYNVYIHTCKYHHVIGYSETSKQLYWFADIDADGVFALKPTPIAICDADNSGDRNSGIQFTQNGHLLTIIDATGCHYMLFSEKLDEYQPRTIGYNGDVKSAFVPPYDVRFKVDEDLGEDGTPNVIYHLINLPDDATDEQIRAGAAHVFDIAKNKENSFVEPFIVCAAMRLYDGTVVAASNPMLMYPCAKGSSFKSSDIVRYDKAFKDVSNYGYDNSAFYVPLWGDFDRLKNRADVKKYGTDNESTIGVTFGKMSNYYDGYVYAGLQEVESYYNNKAGLVHHDKLPSLIISGIRPGDGNWQYAVIAKMSKLKIRISDFDKSYKDIVQSICVFITPQSALYKIADEGNCPQRIFDINIDAPTAEEYGANFDIAKRYWQSVTMKNMLSDEIRSRKPELRDKKDVIHDLMSTPMYLISEIDYKDIVPDAWIDVKIEEGVMQNLVHEEVLPSSAFDRNSFVPKYAYSYNGKLHLANYEEKLFHGWPLQYMEHIKGDCDYDELRMQNWIDKPYQSIAHKNHVAKEAINQGKCANECVVTLDYSDGDAIVVRAESAALPVYDRERQEEVPQSSPLVLNPLITYPYVGAKEISLRVNRVIEGSSPDTPQYLATLETDIAHYRLQSSYLYNFAYYISEDLLPLRITGSDAHFPKYIDAIDAIDDVTREESSSKYRPNGLKVSDTDNPLVFHPAATYQIGDTEIVAMCSNTMAVGTGQTGAVPLYVFCKDGVYGLFVDQSGQMTYSNAKPLARDVCNNADSVTPIDDGVVFTTDRGLMCMVGENVEEIGQPAEGRVFRFFDSVHQEYIHMSNGAFDSVAKLPQGMKDLDDFIDYIKDAVINYNHNERELMVSSPSHPYSYIMDRDGRWGRRNYTAEQYVNNFPTSYRLADEDGQFRLYKVDEDEGEYNSIFVLSQPLKLGSNAFKQSYRAVVRGQFDTTHKRITPPTASVTETLGLYVFGSYDGIVWAFIGGNELGGKFSEIGCKTARADVRYLRYCIAGVLSTESKIDYIEVTADGSKILSQKLR